MSDVYRTVVNISGKPYTGQQNSKLYHFAVEGPASKFSFPEWLADHLVRQSFCQTDDCFRLGIEESPVAAPVHADAAPDIVWAQCADCEQKFEAGSERYAEHVTAHALAAKRQPKVEPNPVIKKGAKGAE